MLHPLQTESVTYIIQRLESLGSLCYLAVLYYVLQSCHSNTPRKTQCVAIAVMLLGIVTKEIVVTMPIVVLLRPQLSRIVTEKLCKNESFCTWV